MSSTFSSSVSRWAIRAAAFSRSSSLVNGRAAASQAAKRGAGSNSMPTASRKAGTDTSFSLPTVGKGSVRVTGLRAQLPR